ncbi:AAA family ATPase [Sphingomonas baiyangensis]|uniref:AAA domain-containing protein n=1 Tax=Sphingomonas baiyangensis TaxID=2572576 RepID=A0A4U1L185_9SPHN|nr:AAA family ATPase [Sphingomonas baiyangensis]TKD50549.1 hypothetical protein FBR43_07070 [Sphingomonas baiyangensis]
MRALRRGSEFSPVTTSFKPARRENVPLLIGFDGASGSGKTYSALLVADGIAGEIGRAQGREGRVFFIDTERGRGLHYADHFHFMHGEISPPFRPQAYGAAINQAEQAGADVIVIDSFSHEHEGEGGLREWAAELEANGKKPPANWMEPKLAHKRLVNQMLASRAHIIVCMRSEEKMRVEAVPQFEHDGTTPKMWKGKQSTKMVITPSSELPMLERWVPICEKRFPFEITTSMLLAPDNPGVPIPRKLQEQHRPFFPEGRRIGREAGVKLARWAMGGAAQDAPPQRGPGDFSEQLTKLREIARPGNMQALQEEWQAMGSEARKALADELPALKAAATEQTDTDGGDYDGV